MTALFQFGRCSIENLEDALRKVEERQNLRVVRNTKPKLHSTYDIQQRPGETLVSVMYIKNGQIPEREEQLTPNVRIMGTEECKGIVDFLLREGRITPLMTNPTGRVEHKYL